MKVTAVIMAGGRGERFWPKSRVNYPKQFLSLTSDGDTMIQKTVKRLLPLVSMEDIFVVTNVKYAALVQEQLPELPAENILLEPCSRNTAPCIGLAAAVIRKKYGDAMMLVLPSDHLIRYEEMYVDVLRQAVAVAERDENLVTIGITPSYPETGYGYIKFERDADLGMTGVYRVECFKENPIWTPPSSIWHPTATCGTAACSCGKPLPFSPTSRSSCRTSTRDWCASSCGGHAGL